MPKDFEGWFLLWFVAMMFVLMVAITIALW
jgi:hypothetical protein